MIDETIRKIEESLRGGAPPARRTELLRLLAELKSELATLETTRRDDAQRIARLTEAAHASARAGGEKQRKSAADRLAESVRDFEATHPRLTSVVEALAESLAAAGL